MNQDRKTVQIEMVSDLVCPWCWLGLRRFLAGRALASEIDVELSFRPYELDPTLPPEGADYRTYMARKFGAEDETAPETNRWRTMRDALEQYGVEEGIPFDFKGITHRPNTVDAHRLVRWAQGQGLGLGAKEALFAAYFTEHRDIGDRAVLADIAGQIGLQKDVVETLLAGDADEGAVKQEAAVFQQMGVRGVPTFIANRRFALQGAEEPEAIATFLRQVANPNGAT